jgi:hypothetical protein
MRVARGGWWRGRRRQGDAQSFKLALSSSHENILQRQRSGEARAPSTALRHSRRFASAFFTQRTAAVGRYAPYPRYRGGGKRGRPRDAFASELDFRRGADRRNHLRSLPLHLCFFSSFLKEEGRRNAGKRCATTAASCDAARVPLHILPRKRGRIKEGARSPDGVPPRLLSEGVIVPRRSSGQASWDAVCTGVTRLRLSQSSDAPRTPVIVPGG